MSNQPLTFTPHGFRRLLITEAIRTGLPPHIAAAICGHQVLDTTMGSAAIHSVPTRTLGQRHLGSGIAGSGHPRALGGRRRSERA
ncbi:hypothetical protein ACFVY1_42825 [Streptomyces sp. NPDC058293]|uniref:hypothetical protein n=1 Tax=Streptomyces sp. NPDC058293 TaxID=3346429 RepID=UPI0036E05DC1